MDNKAINRFIDIKSLLGLFHFGTYTIVWL